jgi:hypothetical protein
MVWYWQREESLLWGIVENDFRSREGVMVIGLKKNKKVELPELEELRHRVKEIKKRKGKMYKRFTNQSKKRR